MSEEESSWDPNRELDGTKGKFKGMAFGVSMRQGSKPYMEIVTVMQQVPGHEFGLPMLETAGLFS
jgi:hypothetical protein